MVDDSTILGYVSLVIAIIAFVLSVAQALQQYISTAEGYRKCAESVMGPWVKHRRRHFVLEELRFAVAFKTPVLFVAHPNNDRGPVTGTPIRNVEGTDKSKELTLSWNPVNTTKEKDSSSSFFTRVHTTNDERASWVTLLAMLQKNEADTRLWDKESRENAPPRDGEKPFKAPEYSMCVQLQGRDRNWDFMPEAVMRPYATSALTHIAEMAIMLGLSWVVFDPAEGNLRAEGNGFALTSSTVQSLGIVISFIQTGPNFTAKYKSNRVIPNQAVKEIMFGTVASIFDIKDENGKTLTYRLNFGDERSVRKMLKYLHCKQHTVQHFLKASEQIRSINFEIIAMLGAVFRLRGSNFKMLPNPTYHGAWIDTFNSCALMREFQSQLTTLLQPRAPPGGRPRPSPQIQYILTTWQDLLLPLWADEESEIDISMREAVHTVIQHIDSFLTNTAGETAVIPVVTAHISVLLEQLSIPDSALSTLEPDDEAELMRLYFEILRPAVVEHAGKQDTNSPLSAAAHGEFRDGVVVGGPCVEDVWMMLQFRAVCWWCLHEFDQTDTKVLDPRWMGSRLPVMIL